MAPERWSTAREPLAHLSAAEQAALRRRARRGALLIAVGVLCILWGVVHVLSAVGGPEQPQFAQRQTYDEVKPIVHRVFFGGLLRSLCGLSIAVLGGFARAAAQRQLYGPES